MKETAEDLAALQALLDRSYAAAGPHVQRIVTPERRPDAAEVAARLTGMRLLVLTTVTADGRPVGGPVDGIFHRGAFHFSSAPDSVRIRHLRTRPAVSATHLPGEEFAVTVHGRATFVDTRAPEHAELRQTMLDIYVPRYGEEWGDFLDRSTSVRIDADRMLAFRMDPESG